LVGWEAEIGSWKLRGVIVAGACSARRTTTWVGSGRLVRVTAAKELIAAVHI